MFNKGPGGFGTSNIGGVGAFGAKPAATFGAANSTPAFGASPSNNPFGTPQTSAFGATSPNAFGKTTSTMTFGAAPTFGAGAGSAFQKSPTSTNFGGLGAAGLSSFGSAGGTLGGFGAATTNQPFGSTSAPNFGGAASAPAFGTNTTPAFGSTATPSFGGFSGPSAGSSNMFGSATGSNLGSFGAATATASTPFGSTPNTNPFGGGGGGFTANPTPTFGGFGTSGGLGGMGTSSTSAFGTANTSTNPFGAGAVATPAFGGGTSTFGAPSNVTGFGAQPSGMGGGAFGSGTTSTLSFGGGLGGGMGMFGGAGTQQQGTGNPPFAPTQIKDINANKGEVTMNMQTITAMKQYEGKSVEELRMEDYQRGNKGQGQGSTMGGFGSTPAFGSGATAFGVPSTTSAFGPTPVGAGLSFGSNPSASSTPFGAAPPTSTFGGGFGATGTSTFSAAPSFGSTMSTTSAPAFGNATNSNFGSTASPAFGAGTFGGSNAGTTATSATPAFSLAATSTAPTLGATTGFGSSATSTLGGFGTAKPSTFSFGTGTGTGSGFGGFGGFGSPTPTATGTNMFGGAAPAATSAFGQPAASTANQSFGSFNLGGSGFAASTAQPTTATPSFGGFGSNTTGGFGQPTTTASFGGFGANKPATTFGTTGFGSLASPTGNNITSGFGGFGASTSGSLGGFGAQPQTATAGFGGFGGFGAPPTQPVSSFNSFQPQQQQIPQQAANQMSLLDQRMSYLDRKKDELEIHLKDDKLAMQSQLLRAQSATKILEESPAILIPTSTSTLATYRHTPRSAAKIVPRSFTSTLQNASSADRPLSSSTITSTLSKQISSSNVGATTSFLRPEGLLSRSAKKLVLGPQFHKPSEIPSTAEKNSDAPLPPLFSDATPIRAVGNSQSEQQESQPTCTGPSTSDISVASAVSDTSSKPIGEPTGLTPSGTRTPFNRTFDTSVSPHVFEDIRTHTLSSTNGVSVTKLGEDYSKPTISSVDQEVALDNDSEPPTPPKLTKAGYKCIPSIEALQSMTREQLSRISHFTVTRPGYGVIEWDGETDVNGIDLDKTVRIEQSAVMVYYEDDDLKNKPQVGQELNKPATVTLYNVLPKDFTNVSKMLQYEAKLRNACQKNGSEFVDYNPVTGRWVFTVEHFSKYGIDDDDEGDSENNTANVISLPPIPPALLTTAVATVAAVSKPETAINEVTKVALKIKPLGSARKLQLDKGMVNSTIGKGLRPSILFGQSIVSSKENSSRKRLSSTDVFTSDFTGLVATSTHLENSYTTQAGTDFNQLVPLPDSTIKRHLFDVDTLHNTGNPTSSPVFASRNVRIQMTDDDLKKLRAQWSHPKTLDYHCSAFSVPIASHILLDFKQNQYQKDSCSNRMYNAYNNSMSADIPVLRKKGIVDYSKVLATSFRVGWTSDGRIIHSGFKFNSQTDNSHKIFNVQQVHIEKVGILPSDQLLSKSQSLQILDATFKAYVNNSSFHSNENNDEPSTVIPQAKFPIVDVSNWDEYYRFLELYKQLSDILKHHGSGWKEGIDPVNNTHPSWIPYQLVEMIQASVGQEYWSKDDEVKNSKYFMPLLEFRDDKPSQLLERRRESISRWLQSICEPLVIKEDALTDAGSYGQNTETFNRIFQLLTCRRITDAVHVAQNAGMFRLAMLLCQADDDEAFSFIIRKQLALWSDMGANEVIPDELLNVYRLLGSVPTRYGPTEKPYALSVLSDLGWARSVGVFYWYCKQTVETRLDFEGNEEQVLNPLEPLAFALYLYKLALSDGDADFPYPHYSQIDSAYGNVLTVKPTQSRLVKGKKHTDAIYNLLEVLYGSDKDSDAVADMSIEQENVLAYKKNYIIAALESESSSPHLLDYRTSYLILSFLTSCGLIPEEPTTNDEVIIHVGACISRQHIISQLISLGLWKWALFVCLTINDEFQRDFLVREVIMRFSGEAIVNSTPHNETWYSIVPRGDINDEYLPQDDIVKTLLPSLDVQYVIRRLNVPVNWAYEAAALFSGYQFDHLNQLHYLRAANQLEQANEILALNIAPLTFLRDLHSEGKSKRTDELITLLQLYNPSTSLLTLDSAEDDSVPNKNEIILLYLLTSKEIEEWETNVHSAASHRASGDHIVVNDDMSMNANNSEYSTERNHSLEKLYARASSLLNLVNTAHRRHKTYIANDPTTFNKAYVDYFNIVCYEISSSLLSFLNQTQHILPSYLSTDTSNTILEIGMNMAVYESLKDDILNQEYSQIQRMAAHHVSMALIQQTQSRTATAN